MINPASRSVRLSLGPGDVGPTGCLPSTIPVVFGFGSSSRLAGAYGFAVSGVMLVTSLAMVVIAVRVWGWRWYVAAPLFGFFAAIEAVFFSSSSLKILHGAWLPLAVGILGILWYGVLVGAGRGRRA